MPLYMSQFSYTPEAMANMIHNPGDRSAQVAKHLEQVGGKLISFYYTFGEYDGICIYEAQDGVDAYSTLAANWATGFLTKVKTTRIFSAEEGTIAFKKARNIEITPPKG